MKYFLVCSNPACRMILDRRINGESLDGVGKIVKKCPECGSAWLKKGLDAPVLKQLVR
jgi:hypothetical protein